MVSRLICYDSKCVTSQIFVQIYIIFLWKGFGYQGGYMSYGTEKLWLHVSTSYIISDDAIYIKKIVLKIYVHFDVDPLSRGWIPTLRYSGMYELWIIRHCGLLRN